MQKSQIKNVYYSTGPSTFAQEKVKSMDLNSAHISSGIKKYMNNNKSINLKKK